MNKILTSMAAAAICVGFASCSSNEITPLSEAEQIQGQYEAAFVKRFGQPASNQTWGFGTITKTATRGASTNSNHWFDENQMNLQKPTDITEAEITYVMNWFATHTKADETVFNLNEYFVQQIGYSNNEYTTQDKDGNTVTIPSYGHMDQIFANLSDGKTDHVNNFNSGSGWIMLMENSETKYGFGFMESYGTEDKTVTANYLMAEIDVPGVGKGYYVGLDYQVYKKDEGIAIAPDGKYDDRVLKIVPAKRNPTKGDIRVIAEDLTVDENGDFDFNDVVFDVKFGNSKTTIILQAAGGTLPLYVAGMEVHEMFGVSTSTMVNTGKGVNLEPVEFAVDGNFNWDANNIPVTVEKNGTTVELQARQGKAPSKIAVGIDYEWCEEKQDIESKYPKFSDYVQNPWNNEWWK